MSNKFLIDLHLESILPLWKTLARQMSRYYQQLARLSICKIHKECVDSWIQIEELVTHSDHPLMSPQPNLFRLVFRQ